MREKLESIRRTLGEIELSFDQLNAGNALAMVSGLELPDILRDVVDLLLPELRPYEAVIYIYLLRHSIIGTGTQYVRVSRRGLQIGMVKSHFAGTRAGGGETDVAKSSYRTIMQSLAALEELGAVRKEGEPNKDGTLYRILLPEEIEVCRDARMKQISKSIPNNVDETTNVDFYNIRENRHKIYERDDYLCRFCQKQLTRFTATLDHVVAVANGGDNSFSNLVTACLDCNSRKNKRPLDDFLVSR